MLGEGCEIGGSGLCVCVRARALIGIWLGGKWSDFAEWLSSVGKLREGEERKGMRGGGSWRQSEVGRKSVI